MTTLDEAVGTQKTPLGADLAAGVEAISIDQQIVFTTYVRVILPLDGFVFWVKADLVSHGAVYNAMRANSLPLNQAPRIIGTAATAVVTGSLHRTTRAHQEEEESIAINEIVFTSEVEIQNFDLVGPAIMFVGEFDGQKFAFSTRDSLYRQANLFHYSGTAVYPDMLPQLIDATSSLSEAAVVSNSLPLWLAINNYVSPVGPIAKPPVTFFPSFLVPENEAPPFISVHVADTTSMQASPYMDSQGNQWQLCQDRVKLTTWGMRNDAVLDMMQAINQYSLATDNIGIMNMPVVKDEKRTQVELHTLAQKKSVEFDVSYYQTRARDVARTLILSAVPTFQINGEKETF